MPLCKTGGGQLPDPRLRPGLKCDEEIQQGIQVTLTLPGYVDSDNGNDCAKKIVDAVNALHGKVVNVPICDNGAGRAAPGRQLRYGERRSNAQYHIVKIASFWVDYMSESNNANKPNSAVPGHPGVRSFLPGTDIDGNGSSSCLVGYFVRYVTAGPSASHVARCQQRHDRHPAHQVALAPSRGSGTRSRVQPGAAPVRFRSGAWRRGRGARGAPGPSAPAGSDPSGLCTRAPIKGCARAATDPPVTPSTHPHGSRMLHDPAPPDAALRRHVKTRIVGQSLVELALILPVFMLFFAAILDLGRIAAAQVSRRERGPRGRVPGGRDADRLRLHHRLPRRRRDEHDLLPRSSSSRAVA